MQGKNGGRKTGKFQDKINDEKSVDGLHGNAAGVVRAGAGQKVFL